MLHHENRLNEILGLLSDGLDTVRQVAAAMKWEINAKSWKDFPKTQKWFAAHETMSHLEHLAHTGRAKRREIEGKLHYTPV